MQISHQGAAVKRRPCHRGGDMGARKRETQREPFAIAFGKKIQMFILQQVTEANPSACFFLLLLWLMFAYILRKTLEIFIL